MPSDVCLKCENMSVSILKLIAVLSMVTDHVSYVLTLAVGMNTSFLFSMRAVGRIAFPISAFLLVNGFDRTKNKKAYLERLFLFALISQIPFSLAFTPANYSAAGLEGIRIYLNSEWFAETAGLAFALVVFFFTLYKRTAQKGFWYILLSLFAAPVCVVLGGIYVLGEQLNVFYTLAVSFAAIWAADMLIRERNSSSRTELWLTAAACIALVLCVLPRSDYGFKGLLLIGALYLAKDKRIFQLIVTAAWAMWMYGYSHALLIGALAACIPLALYNGKLGKKMKTLFYLIYPLHLTALFFIGLALG